MLEITKEEVQNQLGKYITTSNMFTSSGGVAKSQFEVHYENGVAFQSYSSVIAIKFTGDKVSENLRNKIVIGSYYDYSNTTNKYRCWFLGENIKETRKKLNDNIYLFCSQY